MKPNKCLGLRCRLTQPTENGQGIDYSLLYPLTHFRTAFLIALLPFARFYSFTVPTLI
ncbi:hypothetical protein [Anabaena sp. PCC 7108]|uniref:hypothetical protein n=1 Tax=Anabaena sp. PCC 7108 TaxID=163908 RepID=UPI0003470A0D|nr:hypothetical protein [Anabaena sp. PCC 7108]